jgi:DNA invertase Pin-like site-specific DNA recombinase
MKAAIYLRVSSDQQTTDNQLPDLERLATARGYEIVKVYREDDTAWKRGHQRELQKARVSAYYREFDVFMVWSLDRLSRLGARSMFDIVEGFWNLGVTVVSPQDSWIEADNMARPLLLSVFASVAKWESDRRSERTKAGLARVKASGKHIGRPKGKKDGIGVHRKRSGYFKRWEDEREIKVPKNSSTVL